ncbi:MAG TPA: TIGR01777 family oxidoreductase [Streptosporangiaceae bacterium]|nr:TIGR01777 family oxidoreductase [Streptosporangiaceae bacterium]
MTQRVVVIGGTGQIGRSLCRELLRAGHTVVVFSRDPARARQVVPGAADYVAWSPDIRPGQLESADAVVYLAGGSLFDGRRHSRADVAAESRARAGGLGRLVAAMGEADRRPGVLIAASSVGYYGYAGRGDLPVDETHPAGSDWWGHDSAAIEQAALAARSHGVRTVILRTGYVLTPQSLSTQAQQFRRRFGGWIGTGRGWIPWIHIADEVGLIIFALQHPDADGPVNLTAPEPARAREFARALGRAVGHRAWLMVPTPIVRLGLGVVTDIMVRGKRVIPARVSALGYQFSFPVLDAALHDLLGEPDDDTAVAR